MNAHVSDPPKPTGNADLRPFSFLLGGGSMGARMRSHEWRTTGLGDPDAWPQSLRSAVSICLNSGFQIAIYWGTDLSLIYNDAWSPILGRKHPDAVGKPAVEVWPEIWETIGPLFKGVFETGEAVRFRDSLLAMHRHGFTEECYFDYTFSPIRDEGGNVGGIFNAVIETTFRVVGERRTRFLRDLSDRLGNVTGVDEACEIASSALASDTADLPFALIYLPGEAAAPGRLHRRAAAGLPPDHPAAPLSLSEGGDGPWDPKPDVASGRHVLVERLSTRIPRRIDASPWPEPCDTAEVISLGESPAQGVLVAGVSPRLALDQEYQAFLERVAGIVGRAISRGRLLEDERRRAEAVARLDRAKTEFFSNVSHEFRTPITLILGPLDELLADATGENRAALEAAHRNALRLLKLVNSLLDFARIEAGRATAEYQPVDLAQITRDLASNFTSACEHAGLSLTIECEPLSAQMYVDPSMWEKIVLNLLSNAFKFTFSGGIHVSLRMHDSRVVLDVRDTGTGIPPEEIPHLFERFHRVQGARGRSYEGTGIGLALVQELVRLHGGEVGVVSEMGKGTTFSVALPVGSGHLPSDRVSRNVDRRSDARATSTSRAAAYVEEALHWLPAVESPEPPIETTSARDRLRVLVAEDNADMREYIVRLLENAYELRLAVDGQEALEIAQRWTPDVVLSDIMMPRLDGFGLLRELRERDATAQVPIIMLSARAGDEARSEGLERGATDYLVKPFNARELLARIAAHAHAKVARDQSDLLLSRITDGFIALDRDLRYTFANARACELIGVPRTHLIGKRIWDVFPRSANSPLQDALDVALKTGLPKAIEHLEPAQRRWYENRIYPSESGLSVFFVDITRQKEAEEALRETDRRKTEFLAILAHELRNPLAPVRTATHILKSAQKPEDQSKAREIIDRQVATMARLIDDLMDVSRITSGKMNLRKTGVDLRDVVNVAIETSRPKIDAEGQRLSVFLPESSVDCLGDPVRLAQVCANLLNNASRYSERGAAIAIVLKSEAPWAVISVKDNGVGLEPEMLSSVWEMFVQAERADGVVKGGLGIGLTLVRSLVQMHGGTVEARSDGLNLGSEFVVRLPLAPAQEADSKSGDSRQRSEQRRIVIADDNTDAAESLALFLKSQGHETYIARDGVEALTVVSAVQPDVLILDIGMPRLTGHAVASLVRQNPGYEGMTLIALTGWGAEEDRRRAREAGFDHHVVKPADPLDVQVLVNQSARRQRPPNG